MKLIVAEKPKVASKIAFFLSNGRQKSHREKKVTYYTFEDESGENVAVAPAVGHIFTLSQRGSGWAYPVMEFEWKPSYEVSKTSYYTRQYAEVIKKLGKSAESFVSACDYDIEGSLIGYNVFRFLTPNTEPRRMKFSAITKPQIMSAYENLMEFDYTRSKSGEARHTIDWLYGINLSRALMQSLRKSGKRSTLSTGRVQGPALSILSKREKLIKEFVPSPYWTICIWIEKTRFEHKKGKIGDESEAEEIYSRIGKRAKIRDVNRKKVSVPPHPPFDLTSLQIEAYAHFKITPARTLQIAQTLYENSYISYPRTASQKLPRSINLRGILEKMKKIEEYKKDAEKILERGRMRPREGKKDDPAHPAIHPTGVKPKIEGDEKKIYDLIARRFLACFMENAEKEITNVEAESGGEVFVAKGERINEKGWMGVYSFHKKKMQELPEFEKGEERQIEKKKKEKKMTKPPTRYSPASIVSELEKRGLGTKATRATIIEKLYSRNYITGRSIEVTELGLSVVKILEKYAPEITNENFTRAMEEKLDRIIDGKIEMEEVVSEAKEALIPVLERWKKNEAEIGRELAKGLKTTDEESYGVGECECEGQLRIIRTKKGTQFIGCTRYPECKNTYPIPQKTYVKPAKKKCESCGKPVVLVIKNRNKYEMCINTECPSKKKGEKK